VFHLGGRIAATTSIENTPVKRSGCAATEAAT